MSRAGAPAAVTGMSSAVPGSELQSDLWRDHFAAHFAHSDAARRVFAGSGVVRRHAVANPRVEDVSGWRTGERMARYAAEAVPLGKAALAGALDGAGIQAADLGLLAVVSCTGYVTPGVDVALCRDLGMSEGIQRLAIGHMGCFGALPGLGACADYVAARGRPAALVCVELPSLHAQPASDDLEQVVAHALFSDAAAALVVEPTDGAPGALEVVDVAARTEFATADHMTWTVTDLGFRMGLSRAVPGVLARHVGPLVDSLLARHSLGPDDVDAWAIHPGGPRIVDVVADRLRLDAGAVEPSRQVLAEHGNCSSATVLLVLEEIRRRGLVRRGGHAVALAFGPGLTLYAALLRGA